MSVPKVLSLVDAAKSQIPSVWNPHIAGDINDAQVKVVKIGEVFDWHSHAREDEGFLVLEGEMAIDFRERTVEMKAGDFIVVPKGVEHRPRALTGEPIVVLIEPAGTLNTGDATGSDKTVAAPARLT